MAYKLEISQQAKKDLKNLDKPVLIAIRKRLQRLSENVDDIVHLPLTGQFAGLYKLRVYGKYRVIYDLQHENEGVSFFFVVRK